MANIFQGIYHTIEGLIQSILAVFQSLFHVIYSLVHGAFVFAFDLIESVASFVGASVQFVISNIVIITIIGLGVVIYNSRYRSGAKTRPMTTKKKAL